MRGVCAVWAALSVAVATASAADCPLPPLRHLKLPSAPSMTLPYYSPVDVGSADPTNAKPVARYTLAVVSQHGMNRNADDYYCSMVEALGAAYPGGNASVLVVAPRFLQKEDGPLPGELFWDGEDWNKGDPSSAAAGPTASSFDVLDHLVELLSRLPSVRRVVLAGHSAGGQIMVRYAAATRVGVPPGVGLRVVVANPSSFPYLTPERPLLPALDAFAPPNASAAAACPAYDDWRYGLGHPNPYVAASGTPDELRQRFAARDVVYLRGTADTCNEDLDPTCDSHGLDRDCEAMLQGRWRYERGVAWSNYLRYFYGRKVHRAVDVPGVGHDGALMFGSEEGISVLFH
eukprot:m51a1_g1847 hypothetical protein (346) ;mRNA; r:586880-588114